MKKNFQECLQRVFKDEGGYTNDPNDNGGPTNWGITLTDVRKYVKRNATADDVKKLTKEQASDIYKSKYWDVLGCDDLSSGVDYSAFDYGVNSGLGRPRNALKKFSSLSGDELIDAINDERMTFLRAIGVGHNAGFLRGWTNRVTRVRSFSHELAKKNNVAGPTGGAVTVGLGASLASYFHQHTTAILIGTAVVAVLIGVGIHWYKNRGKS